MSEVQAHMKNILMEGKSVERVFFNQSSAIIKSVESRTYLLISLPVKISQGKSSIFTSRRTRKVVVIHQMLS
jgi:hypothetical protein